MSSSQGLVTPELQERYNQLLGVSLPIATKHRFFIDYFNKVAPGDLHAETPFQGPGDSDIRQEIDLVTRAGMILMSGLCYKGPMAETLEVAASETYTRVADIKWQLPGKTYRFFTASRVIKFCTINLETGEYQVEATFHPMNDDHHVREYLQRRLNGLYPWER